MQENEKLLANSAPETEEKLTTICPGCGTVMRVSDKKYAYYCPVCRKLFALKKHRTLVDVVPANLAQEETIGNVEVCGMPVETPTVAPTVAPVETPTVAPVVAPQETPVATVTPKKKKRKGPQHDKFSPLTVSMLVILSVYVAILFFLLLWAVMQIFKHPMDFNKNPIWFPTTKNGQKGFTFVNFNALLAFSETTWMGSNSGRINVGFFEIIVNSLSYALGGSLMNAAVTCLVAYLAARYNYFYSKILYSIVIIVMVIPIVGAQASEIEVLTAIGLWNTRFGFLVLKAGFVGMYFLVFYETFKGIPMTYSEAAMIDGASDWCIMTKVCLPLVTNVFMTVTLITFIQFWNDYQMALLYMPSYPTLAYFLFKVQESSTKIAVPGVKYKIGMDRPPIKMMATTVLMTPILILFIALHERLMGNLSIGGIKG